MNEALKYRLVGAAVLLIGLGLLWPLLFDYNEAMQPEFADLDMSAADTAAERIKPREVSELPGTSGASDTAQTAAQGTAIKVSNAVVPEPRSTERAQPEPPAGDDLVAKNPAAQPQTAQETQTALGKPANKGVTSTVIRSAQPELDAQGIPIAYVIQLGTFSSWKNADQLRNRLNEAGYRAYVRPETSVQPGPYRVQVGPVMTFALAEQLNGELKTELKIADTFIRRFAHHSARTAVQ